LILPVPAQRSGAGRGRRDVENTAGKITTREGGEKDGERSWGGEVGEMAARGAG